MIFKVYKDCKGVGLACSVRLLPAALGPSFLDKGVGTGPIAIHLGLACARTTSRFPDFDYMPMVGKAVTGKL